MSKYIWVNTGETFEGNAANIRAYLEQGMIEMVIEIPKKTKQEMINFLAVNVVMANEKLEEGLFLFCLI